MSDTTDIYELFKQVKAHPDFLFGTIFTRDDLEGRETEPVEDAPFDYDNITDAMVETGNDLLTDIHPHTDMFDEEN